MADDKKFYRSSTDRVIAGVCGGIGEYFQIDPLIIRLIFVLLLIFGGGGLLIYIILWIIMPERDEKRSEDIAHNIKQGADKMASEIKSSSTKTNGRVWVGFIILAIGVIYLMREFFPFLNIGFDKLWPLIIIALGIVILTRPEKVKEIGEVKKDEKEKK